MCLISINKLSGECFISLSLHGGNDTTSPTIAKFCSSSDDPPQSSRRTSTSNFTSSGSQLTVWLRGRQFSATPPSTTELPPPRHLPPRMSFVAAFAFVDSTAASFTSSSSSSSSSSLSTSSERPYADSRLQLHAGDNDNASKSSHFRFISVPFLSPPSVGDTMANWFRTSVVYFRVSAIMCNTFSLHDNSKNT